MNRRITKVALVAAAAMTISLASPVTANANESGSAFAPSPVSAAPIKLDTRTAAPLAITPSNALGTFALRNGVIRYATSNTIAGTIAPAANGGSFKAEVRVNGAYKGLANLYAGGIYYTGSWGSGTVRLGPVHYYSYDTHTDQVAQQYSNYFRIRQGVKWANSPITKRGSKLTFKLKKFRTFTGTRWVSAKRVKLQAKNGKKWRTVRNVKLNKKGNKVVRLTSKSKRKYRVLIPTTSRIQGSATGAKKI